MKCVYRRICSAVALITLALGIGVSKSTSTTYAQDAAPKRTKLNAFQVSMEPLDQELSSQDQLLVRYEIEQILSDYLMEEYEWPSTTTVIFVAVARILEYVTISAEDGTPIGARLTFDGMIYFSDDSTIVPTSDDLAPLVDNALVPEKLVPALQQHFPSVTTVTMTQSFTDSPTQFPTASPTTAIPTAIPTMLPTSSPTVSPTVVSTTDYPTLNPTVSPSMAPTTTTSVAITSQPTPGPTIMTPTGMSLTAAPLKPPTESPTTATSLFPPTTTLQPSLSSAVTPVPTRSGTTTTSPSLSPSLSPSVFTTPDPQTVSEAVKDPTDSSTTEDDNQGIIVGAAVGGLLLMLVVGILVVRNRRSPNSSESTEEILHDLKESESGAEPSPARTMPVGSLDEDIPAEEAAERASKGMGFMKYFSKQVRSEEPPHLAMTDGSDAGESDASELRSDGDQTSLAELYRGCWPRSTATVPSAGSVSSSGASAMVNSVESFERRQIDKHMIRKDILESPDLAAPTLSHYKTGQALMASMNNEEEYDCALAPTDVTAATLAMKPRTDDDDGEGDVERQRPLPLQTIHSEASSANSRSTASHDVDEEGESFTAGLAGLFNSWWGTSKSKRPGNLLGESTDDDTFGGQGDWDPDDETRTSDDQSLPFKTDVEEESLLDSTKNVTYQMQRLRTPPEGPESRPKPIAAPAGPRKLFAAGIPKSDSRAPGSPHPVRHYEAGIESSEDDCEL